MNRLNRSTRRTVAALFAAVVFSCGAAVRAEVAIETVEVGLGNVARPGLWTRLSVTASGSDAAKAVLEVVTPDPSGSPVVFPGGPLSQRSDGAFSGETFFKAGRLETSVTVRLLDPESKKPLATRRLSTQAQADGTPQFTMQAHDKPVWLIVGNMPAFESETHDVTQIPIATSQELPRNWREYSACDVAILAGQFEVSAEQSDALRDWVRNGGHLIVAIGTRSSELSHSPLSGWMLNDRTLRPREISDLSGFELLSETEYRILFTRKPTGTSISQSEGQTLITGIDGDLLVRGSVGFGRVTFLGLDLDKAPLTRWRGLNPMLAKIAELPPVEENTRQRRGRISETGVNDLATQIQTGLEDFPELGTRSTLTVLELVFLYLLLIGPADYFLVHRVLKRPRLTWLTFPVTVLLVGFLASSSASSSNGRALLLNQLTLLDIDAASGFTRQSAMTSVYSPTNERFRVEVQHDFGATGTPESGGAELHDRWTCWFGVPESSFGGMYRRGGLEVARPRYAIDGQHAAIANLPIAVWSDRIVLSEAFGLTPSDWFETDLKQAATGQLTLDSRLRHQLNGVLNDWLIVYGNRVYFHRFSSGSGVADSGLAPGADWHPGDSRVGTQELRSYLTGLSFQQLDNKNGKGGSDFGTRRSEWDSSSKDLFAIARMISLHRLAGGTSYTGLSNELLTSLELSDSMPLNRAILIARLGQPTSPVLINGEPTTPARRDAFLRVLLPVRRLEQRSNLPDFDPNRAKLSTPAN